MRIVEIESEDEWPRQAHNADEPKRRCHAHPGDGPEIGDDFGNPPLPQTPRQGFAVIELLGSKNRLQRGNQSEKSRSLMAHFVDQGGCDAAADHPLARNADHRDWILAASWQPSPRSPDRRADATIEVADHRRGLVVLRQRQGVRRYDVKTRQPDALFGFATLGDDLIEEVELRQNGIEPQPEKIRTGADVFRRRRRCGLRPAASRGIALRAPSVRAVHWRETARSRSERPADRLAANSIGSLRARTA